MNLKKLVSLVLCLTLVLALGACGSKDKGGNTDLVNTLPAIETAPQKDYSQEQILEMYNSALAKIEGAKSYHMYGSTNSTAVFGGMLSSVVNTYDLKCQTAEGKTVGFFESSQNGDGTDYSHTTYHDGERYYFAIPDWKYFKDTNDYQDYYATDYLKPIDDAELQDLEAMDQLDGSVEIRFAVPMADFMSDAILELVGFTSETYEQDIVNISVTLDKDGTMTYFYLSYYSEHTMFEEETEQTIIISMNLDGYDATTVEAPGDLDSYEDMIVEESGDEHEGVGILSPEDVD